MSEKLAEVYEKYDMEITNTRRGRGATILTITDGLRILEPFKGSVVRLEQEHVLKALFEEEGFSDLDTIIPNVNGELITNDRYRQPYVMKKYFVGEECDMRNLADMVRAVDKLADFHICGQNVARRFHSCWEQTKREKEQRQIREIKQALEDGEEIERIAQIYGIHQRVLEEILKEKEETGFDAEKACEGMQKGSLQAGKSAACEEIWMLHSPEIDMGECISHLFRRRNRELLKIQKYVLKVKRRNDFEKRFLQVFSDYHRKGLQCEENFLAVMKEGGTPLGRENVLRHYGICHGSFNQHNVILGNNCEAIVHFERFSRGNQLEDLYQFARKAMEKNHFDYEILDVLLNTYGRKITLSQEDYRYMYVLFTYPEKFWKIANGYYNSKKTFLSPKYLEKLEMVILQEKEKSEMLDEFYSFHLS
ncbi:MAG: hypothetical protein IJP29_05265 [Lachnospiraceae bacterium]|nr:hypothetical protein [Lachnospiraceae bacterium]